MDHHHHEEIERLEIAIRELTKYVKHMDAAIDRRIDRIWCKLHELEGLIRLPNTLTLTVEGAPMGLPISKPVGQTVHFVPTEFDNTTSPPTPFPIVPANMVYTQDVTTFGTLVVNADGSADLTGTAAGVVTVTDTDSVANPNKVLSDSVVVTFFTPAEVPDTLVLTAS